MDYYLKNIDTSSTSNILGEKNKNLQADFFHDYCISMNIPSLFAITLQYFILKT